MRMGLNEPMSRTRPFIVGVTMAVLGGCSSAGEGTATPADAYYTSMKVGKFTDTSHAALDAIGIALCHDLDGIDQEESRLVVQVLRQSTTTDAEAYQVGKAISTRWCPEHAQAFLVLQPGQR